jgi:hypothetical protein
MAVLASQEIEQRLSSTPVVEGQAASTDCADGPGYCDSPYSEIMEGAVASRFALHSMRQEPDIGEGISSWLTHV